MRDGNIILGLYVKGVEQADEYTTAFTIVSVQTHIVQTVIRRETEINSEVFDKWECSCIHDEVRCNHILRAEIYYKNMLERGEQLKKQAKRLAESATRGETPLIESGKRKIKLEGE